MVRFLRIDYTSLLMKHQCTCDVVRKSSLLPWKPPSVARSIPNAHRLSVRDRGSFIGQRRCAKPLHTPSWLTPFRRKHYHQYFCWGHVHLFLPKACLKLSTIAVLLLLLYPTRNPIHSAILCFARSGLPRALRPIIPWLICGYPMFQDQCQLSIRLNPVVWGSFILPAQSGQ